MKRLMILCSVLLLAVAMASPAVADGHDHDHDHIPEHPHALLLNFELAEGAVTFDRCIDLADNRGLPLDAHHHSIHTGTAGFGNPDVGLTRAGHAVVPLQPYPEALPFEDCADIEAFAQQQ